MDSNSNVMSLNSDGEMVYILGGLMWRNNENLQSKIFFKLHFKVDLSS